MIRAGLVAIKEWWLNAAWPNVRAAAASGFTTWCEGVQDSPLSHLITTVAAASLALLVRWVLA